MNFSTKLNLSIRWHEITIRRLCECSAGGILCHPPPFNPQNLPLLPIPKLENTIKKLLRSVEPFVTHCEFTNFQIVCDKFVRCDGRALQNDLLERAKHTRNWLDEWHRKYIYLCNRDSLPMGASPILLFPTQEFHSKCDQIGYAAKLILGALKFRRLTKKNRLSLDTWERHPLDMSIYNGIFSRTRVPNKGLDDLMYHPKSNHIIVMVRNNAFKLKVLNDVDEPLSYNQLMTRLEDIVENGNCKGIPFGILTSMDRDRWARARDQMLQLPDNKHYSDMIEKALFVICIDEGSPFKQCSSTGDILNGCRNAFHGHGLEINAANRWYDKTLQYFVSRDGSSGVIFEQSWVDALPLGKMADFIVDYIRGTDWVKVPFLPMFERATQLYFVTSDEIDCTIKQACDLFKNKMSNFDCELLHFDKYGKGFCKENNVSADGLIQVALQQAYCEAHGRFAPQLEKASTRKFYQGRNDAIRSCTCEMQYFLKNAKDQILFQRDKYEILQKALSEHRQLSDDAKNGKGIDCHLFGLLIAAQETGRSLPRLYSDIAFQKGAQFRIVSRQLNMLRNSYMCYPPDYVGGYGVCYNPRAEDINICVTCRKDDCECDVKKFLEGWEGGMKMISNILCSCSKREKVLCE